MMMGRRVTATAPVQEEGVQSGGNQGGESPGLAKDVVVKAPTESKRTVWKRASTKGRAVISAVAVLQLGNAHMYMGRHSEAARCYKKLGERGDAIAQRNMGLCYAKGRGVEQDYSKAFTWFSMAASQGDALAAVFLGNCYSRGQGIQRDDEAAAKWYTQASVQNEPEGVYRLGVCAERGHGVPQSWEAAKLNYLHAAQLGHVDSMVKLGYVYESGLGEEGAKPEVDKAQEWYEKASTMGSPVASVRLRLLKGELTREEAKGEMAILGFGKRPRYSEQDGWLGGTLSRPWTPAVDDNGGGVFPLPSTLTKRGADGWPSSASSRLNPLAEIEDGGGENDRVLLEQRLAELEDKVEEHRSRAEVAEKIAEDLKKQAAVAADEVAATESRLAKAEKQCAEAEREKEAELMLKMAALEASKSFQEECERANAEVVKAKQVAMKAEGDKGDQIRELQSKLVRALAETKDLKSMAAEGKASQQRVEELREMLEAAKQSRESLEAKVAELEAKVAELEASKASAAAKHAEKLEAVREEHRAAADASDLERKDALDTLEATLATREATLATKETELSSRETAHQAAVEEQNAKNKSELERQRKRRDQLVALQEKVEKQQAELAAATEKVAGTTDEEQQDPQDKETAIAAQEQRIEVRERRVAEAEERLKSRKRRDEKRAADLENAMIEMARLRKEKAALESQVSEISRKEQAVHDAELRVQEESSFVDRKLDHLNNMVDLTAMEHEVSGYSSPDFQRAAPRTPSVAGARDSAQSPLTAESPMDAEDATFSGIEFDAPAPQSLQSRMDAALAVAVSGPSSSRVPSSEARDVPKLSLDERNASSTAHRQQHEKQPAVSTSSAMGKSAALLSKHAAKRASILGRTSAAGSPRGAMVHTGANQTVASAIRAVSPFANSPRSRLGEKDGQSPSPRVLYSNDGIPVLDEGMDRRVSAELKHYRRKVEADHSKQRQALHDRRNYADIAMEGRFGERKTREEREREIFENDQRLQRLQQSYRAGGARPGTAAPH